MDKKWDSIRFELKTPAGTRSLRIDSNFQKVDSGWFDTGLYIISEGTNILGQLGMDLYTDSPSHWSGKPDEFTEAEMYEIEKFIAFYDPDDQQDAFLN